MKALWPHLDEAVTQEPLPGPEQNSALTHATFAWLGDRLTQDDVIAELQRTLPTVNAEELLAAIGAIVWMVKQP